MYQMGRLFYLLCLALLWTQVLSKSRKNKQGKQVDVIDKHITTLQNLLRPNPEESLLEENLGDSLFNAGISSVSFILFRH